MAYDDPGAMSLEEEKLGESLWDSTPWKEVSALLDKLKKDNASARYPDSAVQRRIDALEIYISESIEDAIERELSNRHTGGF